MGSQAQLGVLPWLTLGSKRGHRKLLPHPAPGGLR